MYVRYLVHMFLNTCKISCLKNSFVIIIIFTKWKFVSFAKKTVLVMYHSFECFQKLTDISKKYHNYSLIHTQANKTPCINQNLPKEQYATHQNKKVKTSHDNDFNSNAENSNFDFELNYHNHSSPIYDSSLLNQQTEFNNRIKNTIKMKHNLAEIFYMT